MCLTAGSCEGQSKALELGVLAPCFVFTMFFLLHVTRNAHFKMWKDTLGSVGLLTLWTTAILGTGEIKLEPHEQMYARCPMHCAFTHKRAQQIN